MKLITLSGVDGSGKSTQLKFLKEKLERDNKKVFYFHAVEFSLANRLARIFKKKKGFVPGEEKASTQASLISLQLRIFFLFIDIFRFKSLQKKLDDDGYNYILSDRYFYDSVINILYLSKKSKVLCLKRLIPKPDYAFYFRITAEEIMDRERVPEQGIDYLSGKINIFEQKKDVFELISIDASQTQTLLTDALISKISI